MSAIRDELGRFDELAPGYEDWFGTPLGRYVADLELDLVLALLRPRPGERLLEVGAGTGFFLRAIARTGARCVGIEPSGEMLSVAATRGPREVTYVRGRGEALPFRDGAFDGLLYMTTLEFVQDPEAAISEAARGVRPGGRLVFGVLNAKGPWAGARRRQGGLWANAHFYTREELQALLAPLGRLDVRFCVHVPPTFGRLPAVVMKLVDWALRRLMPESGALIGVRVDLAM